MSSLPKKESISRTMHKRFYCLCEHCDKAIAGKKARRIIRAQQKQDLRRIDHNE